LTNDAGDILEFMLTHHQAQLGVADGNHSLLTMPEDIRRVLFAAHVDYLRAGLDQIACDHGDIHKFLRAEIGVDEAMRSKIRATLLSAD
jgi:protein-tyrosine phosphatase